MVVDVATLPVLGDIYFLQQIVNNHYCQDHNSELNIKPTDGQFTVWCPIGQHYPFPSQITKNDDRVLGYWLLRGV